MVATIQKQTGNTRTEKLLAHLSEKTFLNLWSYPTPYKDDGKELCDLLVVFENYVFIFFDRESDILLNRVKDPELLWKRWKKKVIDDQIRTARGAKKYILRGCKAPCLCPNF